MSVLRRFRRPLPHSQVEKLINRRWVSENQKKFRKKNESLCGHCVGMGGWPALCRYALMHVIHQNSLRSTPSAAAAASFASRCASIRRFHCRLHCLHCRCHYRYRQPPPLPPTAFCFIGRRIIIKIIIKTTTPSQQQHLSPLLCVFLLIFCKIIVLRLVGRSK